MMTEIFPRLICQKTQIRMKLQNLCRNPPVPERTVPAEKTGNKETIHETNCRYTIPAVIHCKEAAIFQSIAASLLT